MLKMVVIPVLAASFLAVQDVPVPVIELTNTVVRNRLREPVTASASGDSVGYQGATPQNSPLVLELVSLNGDQPDDSLILIGEFEVRNVGRQDVDIPVDPSSRDFEPASSATPYRYLKAYLWLAAEPGASEKTPTTGLFLYGNRAVPASIRTLKPGQTVRIRARIPVSTALQGQPGADADMNQTRYIRAFLALFDETITPQKQGLHSSTKEIFPTVSSSRAVERPL